MATKGRRPKPTELKVLEGNPGKRKLNAKEPKPEKKAPACPAWLMPEAKKEWRRLAKSLEAMGLLTENDRSAFAAYCQAYARWKEAEERITDRGLVIRTPSGYPQQVPYISIAQQYLRLMGQYAERFGLDPSSRSRIIAGKDTSATTGDEMDDLLGGEG